MDSAWVMRSDRRREETARSTRGAATGEDGMTGGNQMVNAQDDALLG